MPDTESISRDILQLIDSVIEGESPEITPEFPLLGDASSLDSIELVELCIKLEDLAGDLGFEFDWSSDKAMSKSQSMFRTAATLTEEFLAQREAQQ
ncbi:MAG TPA: hypothetical protein DD979_01465 [Gammaproteobacteria bacterium]|jgi:acyl carrier protein|nr:hypothetical protein [Gammaproteobacteria bacterium]